MNDWLPVNVFLVLWPVVMWLAFVLFMKAAGR